LGGRRGRRSGRNPKSLTGEECGPEFRIGSGAQAFFPQRAAPLVSFEHVEGDVSDDDEVIAIDGKSSRRAYRKKAILWCGPTS
jgi:hypothetical protein